jgi:hypothetical protein
MNNYFTFRSKSGDPEKYKIKVLITALIKHLLELGIIDADALNTVYNTVEVGAEKEVKKHKDSRKRVIKKVIKTRKNRKMASFYRKNKEAEKHRDNKIKSIKKIKKKMEKAKEPSFFLKKKTK